MGGHTTQRHPRLHVPLRAALAQLRRRHAAAALVAQQQQRPLAPPRARARAGRGGGPAPGAAAAAAAAGAAVGAVAVVAAVGLPEQHHELVEVDRAAARPEGSRGLEGQAGRVR